MQYEAGTTELNSFCNEEILKAIDIYLNGLSPEQKEMKWNNDAGLRQLHELSLVHIIECAAVVQLILNKGLDKNECCTIEQIFNYNFCLESMPEILTLITRRMQYRLQNLPDGVILGLLQKV